MTTSFLRLPVDIPWERICVTQDMLDPNICDRTFPPKWQSSIAVFKYRPGDDYQEYPNHDVIYLKVAVTLSGYQPRSAEIEGTINWNGLNVTTLQDVESLLNEYHPCTGALIQVEVAPSSQDVRDPKEFPYFLDFEPKKRELFEMATDTKEKMSRSLESLNVGKSTGTTQSQEVLDIDGGGGGGGNVTVFGTGGGFNYQHTGQWGTKQVGTNEGGVTRTTDQGTERRETASFTTQLTQLYHTLDSYHLGTNRVLFFVQPRPHTLEQPSGFVRGPRPVEGIQEFFLVVLKPKRQDDICVSVRVDTAHLAEIDIMDYATRTDEVNLSVSVPPPERNDPQAVLDGYDYMNVSYGPFGDGKRRYKCYRKTVEQIENYTSPWSDYRIDVANNGGYSVTSATNSYGSYSVAPAPDGSVMPTRVYATARKCWNDGGDFCVDCPDTWHARSANSSLSLVVYLVSKEPIVKVGTDQVLLITTRGLCCCASGVRARLGDGVLSVKALGPLVAERGAHFGLREEAVRKFVGEIRPTAGMSTEPGLARRGAAPAATKTKESSPGMSPQEANALGQLIRSEVIGLVAGGRADAREPVPYVLSDYFLHKLETRMRHQQQLEGGKPGKDVLGRMKVDRKGLETYFGESLESISADRIARAPTDSLAAAARVKREDAVRLRLAALGIELAAKESEPPRGDYTTGA